MDPLTHTLTGAALARTRPARGLPLAGPALVIAANLPDLDVLSQLGGSDFALGFRRGWTHGPLGLVLLPALLAAVLIALDAWLRRRRQERAPPQRVRLLALVYLGCLTHPLLDWLNTYGIRWLMPFDRRWFYGDAVFIVDPWLWLMLGGALFLGSRRSRRGVAGWALLALAASLIVIAARAIVPGAALLVWFGGLLLIGLARRTQALSGRAELLASLGLALAGTYVACMLAATNLAERHVRMDLARASVGEIHQLMIGPAPANPLRWQVVAATDDAYRHGRFEWWPSPRFALERGRIARPAPSPLLDAVLTAPQVQGAVSWMRFPYLEVEQTDEGYTVHLLDARYARPGSRGFGTAVLHLDRTLRVREESAVTRGE